MTDIVIDKNKIERYMEECNNYLKDRQSEIFYLPQKITFKHLITEEEGSITNLPFIYVNCNYYIVKSISDFNTGIIDKICPDITHVNISRNNGYILTPRYKIVYSRFCNGLNNTPRETHFREGMLDIIKQTLIANLPSQNPSSGYFRAENYLGLFDAEQAMRCRECQTLIKPTDNPIQLITQSCGVHVLGHISEIRKNVWYYKPKNNSRYIFSDVKPAGYEFGSYPIFSPQDIENILKDYKIDVDMTVVGCGSAGANITLQLARTEMIGSAVLIDKDNIEQKNLRNQPYGLRDIYYNKAQKLKDLYGNIKNTPIVVHQNWIENIAGSIYNSKYLLNTVDLLTVRDYVNKNMNCKYIIDTRFKDLDCSIYFIDRDKKDQQEYYDKSLSNAIKSYVEDIDIDTDLISYDMCEKRSWRVGALRKIKSLENKSYTQIKKYSTKWYNKLPLSDKEKILKVIDASRHTCNSPNIIDIYTIVAGLVVSAIREIDEGREKPWTHIEITSQGGKIGTMVVKD